METCLWYLVYIIILLSQIQFCQIMLYLVVFKNVKNYSLEFQNVGKQKHCVL